MTPAEILNAFDNIRVRHRVDARRSD